MSTKLQPKVAAVADRITAEESSSTLNVVKDLRRALSKLDLSSDSGDAVAIAAAQDILTRLNECHVTYEILTETMIGKNVARLRNHPNLGTVANALVKKWKAIAAAEESNSKATSIAARKTAKSALKTGAALATPNLERRPSADVEHEAAWANLPSQRQTIARKLYECLTLAKPGLVDQVHVDALDHLIGQRATELEEVLHYSLGVADRKAYIDKARSLNFNLSKNLPLSQSVVMGRTSSEELLSMGPEQLASADIQQQRSEAQQKMTDAKRLDWEQANEDKINEMCGIKGELLRASLFTCSRCKSTKTTSTQKQTRSADEPMTVFVFCTNCGKRWKC